MWLVTVMGMKSSILHLAPCSTSWLLLVLPNIANLSNTGEQRGECKLSVSPPIGSPSKVLLPQRQCICPLIRFFVKLFHDDAKRNSTVQ